MALMAPSTVELAPVGDEGVLASTHQPATFTEQRLWPGLPIVRSRYTRPVSEERTPEAAIIVGGLHHGLLGRIWPGNRWWCGASVTEGLDEAELTYDWTQMPRWWRHSFAVATRIILVGHLRACVPGYGQISRRGQSW